MNNLKVVVEVGEKGDGYIGLMEIVEMIFSIKGLTVGADNGRNGIQEI
jgi:hypothetical protein